MRDIKLLSLSTAHLSEATVSFLATTDCMGWPALGGPYRDVGWVFHVDQDAGGLIDQPAFQDLYDAFRFAADRGYSIVLFYDIEETIDDLPVYRDLETEYDVLYEGSPEWRSARGRASPPSSGSNILGQAERLLVRMKGKVETAHDDILANQTKLDRKALNAELDRLKTQVESLRVQLIGFQTMLAYVGEQAT
jgi:hypothetical protein